jgi:hypothetical protein
MRMLTIPFAAALLFVRDLVAPAPAPPAAPPPEPAVEEAADPAGQVLAPPPVTAIRETSAPVPAGVTVKLRKAGASGWKAELIRRGYLVALRRGGERTAGEDVAVLPVAADGGDDEPMIWETTKLDTLETTRGTLRFEGDAKPVPRIRLAEPPVAATRERERLHTCVSHEDGAGGFTVLCRVPVGATAASVTGDDPRADVWMAGNASRVVRMDLPAPAEGAEARVVGYAMGALGVVIRAEATRAAGEDRASLAILSSDRPQPMVPRRAIRYTCCVF